MANQKLSVNDPEFVDKIIFEVKSSGHFDAFRKECLSDVDINPAYQNLHSRVEDSVQKFLNRQIYTPDTNKIRLREDMRVNIIRAGFLESGVSRIVDQVVEQKIDSIQCKVEEILYKYLGIEKPIKEEKKNGALDADTDLMPIDLEQVSDKTSLDSLDMKEDKEEIEEEIIDDDDFESPAFEPVISESKMENTQNSNLSAISGLTSQDSAENNSGKNDQVANEGKVEEPKAETGLSQISTVTQDNIPDTERAIGTALIVSGISGEEAQMAPSLNDSMEIDGKPKDVDLTTPPIDAQKSQFDLNKDVIEFTGTERKNISLDDSTNSGESEKALQPQDVKNTNMDIDRLYENDTTDSSEMKMEIDLKDESTQETANSSRVENETSSRESLKEKNRKEQKNESSREPHQSSSHRSSRNHQSSSSSKFKHDKSKSSQKSSSHKKSSSDKEKSSSSRRDREKDSKGDASSKSRSKNESDDHHQEKVSRRRRSTDHDSHDGKDGKDLKQSSRNEKSDKDENKKTKSDQQDKLKSTDNKATDNESEVSNKNEKKSSILEKHDYIKSPRKSSKRNSSQDSKNDDFHGFAEEKIQSTKNPWFNVMDLIKNEKLPKFPNTKKARTKNNKADVNGESTSSESPHEQKSNHSQRYDANELYKPKFDFRRRRTQINEEDLTKEKVTAPASN